MVVSNVNDSDGAWSLAMLTIRMVHGQSRKVAWSLAMAMIAYCISYAHAYSVLITLHIPYAHAYHGHLHTVHTANSLH